MYIVDLTNETWTLISKQAIILFPIDPDVGALIQPLRLEATVFQRPNPTQYGDTLLI